MGPESNSKPEKLVLLWGPCNAGYYWSWDMEGVLVSFSTSLENVMSSLERNGFRIVPNNGQLAIAIRDTIRRRRGINFES